MKATLEINASEIEELIREALAARGWPRVLSVELEVDNTPDEKDILVRAKVVTDPVPSPGRPKPAVPAGREEGERIPLPPSDEDGPWLPRKPRRMRPGRPFWRWNSGAVKPAPTPG